MDKWKLKRTKQCDKCPFRKDVDPFDIPDGYCPDKHAALRATIAEEGDYSSIFAPVQRVMACHETDDAHCVGWLYNQLGDGNNIGLRIQMMSCENAKNIKVIGEQHETFEDTLPKILDQSDRDDVELFR